MAASSITMHASVRSLESVVKRARDILRKGEGITDMDSMTHCVLFTAARMMDKTTAAKLAVPHLWSSVYDKIKAKDVGGAEAAFKKILAVLDDKFEMSKFPWKLTVQQDFEKIVCLFNEVDIHDAAKHTDVLGFIYEQHLNTGSGSGRDLGKFYTDRTITRYLAELLGSDITNSRPDSMCDATMGTGGFILSYIDMVTKQCPTATWEEQDLAGGDIDDKVAAIARLNVFIRTGMLFPMIRKRNTLKNDIGELTKERRTFKRLLMNIPFGVKGLTLADDTCERVRDIVKAGTKSEPLFLALTFQLLDDGGKAAVIIPDGVLVNSSKQSVATRKYLFENFELKRVVKMHGQFFMNTNIQPSVLIFERTGLQTSEVEFWEVEKSAAGSMIESHILTVPRENFDNSFVLDVRRYLTSTVYANPGGYPLVKVGDLVDGKSGENVSPEEVEANPGEYPVVSGGRNPTKTYSKYNREANQITISKFGSYAGFVRWNETRFWSLGSITLVPKATDRCNIKFLYYYLSLNNDRLYGLQRTGPTTNFYWSDAQNLEFVLPPLSVQNEVVTVLDLITNNALVATRSIDSLKAQMAAFMQTVGARGYDQKSISDLLQDVSIRQSVPMKDAVLGTVPLYSSSKEISSHTVAEFDATPRLIQGSRGTIADAVYYSESPFSVSNNMFVFKQKSADMSLKFIFYYLKLTRLVETIQKTVVIPMISKGDFFTLTVPMAPLNVQQDVLSYMSEMEAELAMLEQMAAKAEQRAKFILDGYLTPAPVLTPAI